MLKEMYEIPVWDTITTALDKVYGAKTTFWIALLIFFPIMFGLGFMQGALENYSDWMPGAIKVIANVIGYFMQMGIMYIGIKRALDAPINYRQVFRAFEAEIAAKIVILYVFQMLIFLPVIIFLILVSLLTSYIPSLTPVVPILLFVLGGAVFVYLSIRMLISNALVLDKATPPWDAIKISFNATRGNFWACLALIILQILIVAVSAIPFGLGLIWTLPLTFICYGVMYKRLNS